MRIPRASFLVWLCGLGLVVAGGPTGARETNAPVVLRQLGGPRVFSRPPLETPADLQRVFRERRADVVEVLEKAGWEGDPADLLRAVAAGEITERTFPPGGELEWMAFRTPREVDVHRGVVWAGEEPFEAYEVRLLSNDWRWTFVVPKICANLALLARAGPVDLQVAMVSGILRLRDPEGREIVVRGGESATVTAPRTAPPAELGEPGVLTTLGVEGGSVDFRDRGHPIAVTVGSGYEVKAVLTPARRLALEVPETNPGPLPIRVGDAVGDLSVGAHFTAGWPAEKKDDEPPAARVGFAGPYSAPRSGIHDAWILGTGAEIKVEVTDSGLGVERWVAVLDGEEAPREALTGPWTPGDHTVAVRAVDRAGNRSESEPVRFLFDPDPPRLRWGVEGIDPVGATRAAPSPGKGAAPRRRGHRTLSAGGREWRIDYDTIQIVLRPQTRKRRRYSIVDEPLGADRGLWIVADDQLCPDMGRLTYDLVEAEDGPYLEVEAVDCVGNAARGRWSLARSGR